ncbi:lipopolysaccharide/colanic/teichoic acid biosynthesis glycosyltransferase [Bifidobacterium commune]|nr:lipopolysaccharide/colanic/teichoic acid biosynthesis glycosyltransferase [Bifidobacterium commune]
MHFRNDPNMPALTAKLPQYTTRARMFKRVMDIVLSLFAIIVLAIPMLIIVFKFIMMTTGPYPPRKNASAYSIHRSPCIKSDRCAPTPNN